MKRLLVLLCIAVALLGAVDRVVGAGGKTAVTTPGSFQCCFPCLGEERCITCVDRIDDAGKTWCFSRCGFRTIEGGCIMTCTYKECPPEVNKHTGSVSIIGSAKTSMLIVKQWDGNSWQHPKYMESATVESPNSMYWFADYVLYSGLARFGLFERGVVRGQDQHPVWITDVKVLPGEHQEIVVHEEELHLHNEVQ